jgi:hypothetical protein
MEYMTLMGAEQVQNAACTMRNAADSFSSSVGSFSYEVDRLIHAMEEHSCRIEEAMKLSTTLPEHP